MAIKGKTEELLVKQLKTCEKKMQELTVVIFLTEFRFYTSALLGCDPPIYTFHVAGIIGHYCHTQFFFYWLRWSFTKCLASQAGLMGTIIL
jgi:hypothetical protein